MDEMEIGDLDPTTNQVIDSRVQAANQLANTTAEDEGKAFLKREEINPFMGNPTPALGGQQSMSRAIKNRAERSYQSEIERMRELRELNINKTSFEQIMGAAQIQNERYAFQKQREIAIKKRIMDQRAQRAQVLSSILQIGGTAVGGYLGGPAGAAGGAAAGKGLGTAATSSMTSGDDLNFADGQA